MDTLVKIFGGVEKVKVMRLFLFNPQTSFSIDEISKKAKINSARARREVKNLEKSGLIKTKTFTKEVLNGKNKKPSRIKKNGWILNEKFTFLKALQNFLINITSSQHKEMVRKVKRVGNVRLLILSGVFIQEWDSRVDMLIVGDKIRNSTVLSVISDIESEVGKELKYSVFETSDFLYRLGVCDKLVRDVLDYPHQKLINKIDI